MVSPITRIAFCIVDFENENGRRVSLKLSHWAIVLRCRRMERLSGVLPMSNNKKLLTIALHQRIFMPLSTDPSINPLPDDKLPI